VSPEQIAKVGASLLSTYRIVGASVLGLSLIGSAVFVRYAHEPMINFASSHLGMLLLTLLSLTTAWANPSSLLNEHAMLMAHDSATTYLEAGVINNWVKTQPDGGFAALLECGTRAFDWRPALVNGQLVFHHGAFTVPHLLDDAIQEVIAWAAANGTSVADLVIIHLFTCSGDGCDAAVNAVLARRNLTYITDCSQLKGLTVETAFARSRTAMGGAVLFVKDCLQQHYEPSIACSGYNPGVAPLESVSKIRTRVLNLSHKIAEADRLGELYLCYTDSHSRDGPLNAMWTYLNGVSVIGPPASGELYSHQALWQENGASIAIGVLHLSSLLEDERRSQLNLQLVSRIVSGAWNVSRANLVEVNNVCDGGPMLLRALRKAQDWSMAASLPEDLVVY